MKNGKNTYTLANLAKLAKQTLNFAKNGGCARTRDAFPQGQIDAAKHVSSILSALYRQKSESEWEWLRINRPEWWQQRVRLENELDGYFLDGDLEAGQEAFYRLMGHLKTAPINKLSSRIARQLDNLPTCKKLILECEVNHGNR